MNRLAAAAALALVLAAGHLTAFQSKAADPAALFVLSAAGDGFDVVPVAMMSGGKFTEPISGSSDEKDIAKFATT